MGHLSSIISSFASNPAYTSMRGVGRFKTLRKAAGLARAIFHRNVFQAYVDNLNHKSKDSIFCELDRINFVHDLDSQGIAFSLKLPPEIVSEIKHWALTNPSYADRDPKYGFNANKRDYAENILQKPILLSQYFNTTTECDAIRRLSNDPVLLWIAASYLKSIPTFVGANLWWTFPVKALESDRNKHAHIFHRDVDDFKFFKFFFYLTDVPTGEGAHVCVTGSHINPPKNRFLDPWVIRRYSDEEISNTYPADCIKEICGEAGDGFAENTFCIHKGSTPKTEARLLLQLQFALFDHGVMHDRRSPTELAML